jgi:hypothetical protein
LPAGFTSLFGLPALIGANKSIKNQGSWKTTQLGIDCPEG